MSTTEQEGDSQARESVQNVKNFYQLGKKVPLGRGYRTKEMVAAVRLLYMYSGESVEPGNNLIVDKIHDSE